MIQSLSPIMMKQEIETSANEKYGYLGEVWHYNKTLVGSWVSKFFRRGPFASDKGASYFVDYSMAH